MDGAGSLCIGVLGIGPIWSTLSPLLPRSTFVRCSSGWWIVRVCTMWQGCRYGWFTLPRGTCIRQRQRYEVPIFGPQFTRSGCTSNDVSQLLVQFFLQGRISAACKGAFHVMTKAWWPAGLVHVSHVADVTQSIRSTGMGYLFVRCSTPFSFLSKSGLKRKHESGMAKSNRESGHCMDKPNGVEKGMEREHNRKGDASKTNGMVWCDTRRIEADDRTSSVA